MYMWHSFIKYSLLTRKKERQLNAATASASEARKDAERYQRSLKELEEQVQNDDRLKRVETSLKNTQERADELEFQLSKVKHVSICSQFLLQIC